MGPVPRYDAGADSAPQICMRKSEHRNVADSQNVNDLFQFEREQATAEHRQPIYSGKCRSLDPVEAQRRRAAGEACAIRLRIPEHPIRFHDIVHGEVEFSNEVVSDPIILGSSGMPVYNYVVVIDDALMKITHVIRGDDHLSNTPKQVALYEALCGTRPYAGSTIAELRDQQRSGRKLAAPGREPSRAFSSAVSPPIRPRASRR